MAAREYEITGRQVGLSLILPEDRLLLFALWRDSTVQRNLNFRAPQQTFHEWLDEQADAARPRMWFECAIACLADDAFIGYGSLGRVTTRPELMVLLLPEYRGRGFGMEAARLLVEYGFVRLGLDYIGGGAMEFNRASQRMLEKAGFVRTPASDGRYANAWTEGTVVEYDYVIERARWERLQREGRS